MIGMRRKGLKGIIEYALSLRSYSSKDGRKRLRRKLGRKGERKEGIKRKEGVKDEKDDKR